MIYNEIYIVKGCEVLTSNLRFDQEKAGRKEPRVLCNSDQQSRESPSSKLQDLDMKIQGSQNSPGSGDADAKWLA